MPIGSGLGGFLGSVGSSLLPIPGVDGEKLGSFIGGSLLPFQKGGRVVPKYMRRGGRVKKAKKAVKAKKPGRPRKAGRPKKK